MSRRIILVAAALCVVAMPGLADVLHLKDGGKLEGEILREEGGKIILKTRFGVVPVERSRVARIEKKLTVLQDYGQRRKALAPDDADGHYELALFCKKHGMIKEEKALYPQVLEIDDQHPGANRVVGNVEHDGTWMTPAARDRLMNAADDEAKRAQGLVPYEGRWVTPEEKENLEKGLVRHNGKWMTPEAKKREEGFVPYKGGWIKKEELERRIFKDLYGVALEIDVNVAITPHFVAAGPFEQTELEEICDAAEQAYDQFRTIFGIDPAENLFGGRPRCHIVYTKRALDYSKFVDYMLEKYPEDVPEDRADLMKSQNGFYHVYPACYIAGCQFPNTFDQVKASVIHKASHILLMRYRYRAGFFPWWLIEGLGTYQEISALGHCDTFCISEVGYSANDADPKNKWIGLSRWKDVAKKAVAGMADKPLLKLTKTPLNALGFRDLAKCWSICEWLVGSHPKEFVALVDALKGGAEFPDAVQDAFGKPHELIDREWREYVRSNY